MKPGTLLLTEDIAGASVQAGLRGRLYGAFAGLVKFAAVTSARKRSPVAAVLPESFSSLMPAGTRVYTSNYVTSLGLATVDMEPLLAFHPEFFSLMAKACPAMSPAMIHAVSYRVVLAGLLEHAGKPAEAFARLFRANVGVSRLLLLGGASLSERMAADVAKHVGWSVETTLWRILLGPLGRLKQNLQERHDGLPSTQAIGSSYSSAEAGDPPVPGTVTIFCTDERRIRRFAEPMQLLAKRGTPVTLAVLNVKQEVRSSIEALSGTGLRVRSVNRYLPAGAVKSPENQAKQGWNSVFANEEFKARHQYQGVSLAEVCLAKFGVPWAKFSFEAEFFSRAAGNYLDTEKPRLVVLSDVSIHSILMAGICEERGIPTVFYVYNPVLFTASFWTKMLFEAFRARYVFTATSYMSQVYIRDGRYDSAQLKVVGDLFAAGVTSSERDEARREVRRDLGLKEDAKIVLALSFFVGPDISETQKRRYLRCIARGVEEAGAHLVVKAHPNESKELLRSMLAEEGIKPALLAHTESLKRLLLASDAAGMVYSQAGMEVIMMDIPLFLVQDPEMLAGYEEWVPYSREGAAVFVPDNASFAEKLRPILFDPAAREAQLKKAALFREKYITSAAIDPVDRMVAELESLR
ncbi:MAG: hypothetical protein ACXWR1_19010 [Bdellovibrionota bacterium]